MRAGAPAGRRCRVTGGGALGAQPRLQFFLSLEKIRRIKERALGFCSPGKADTLLYLVCPTPYVGGEPFALW